jgi:hypothetical protein
MIEQSGNHVHAAPLQLRHQNFDRVTVEENPGHAGKRPAKQRQREGVPAVQLHEEMPFLVGSHLAEGADDPAQPRGVLRVAEIGPLALGLHHGIDRACLGDDDVARDRRQHLRQQCRAAAGHVENESGRRQAGTIL